MIVIVPPSEYRHFQPELREMHRLRYRVFKERLKWDVTVVDGMERDEYDDLRPTYILAIDDEGAVVGSWRMLPTTGPNMLANTFPQLLDGQPMPTAPDIWECSRFSVDTPAGRQGSLRSMNRYTSEIICGLIEHSLNMGITDIITVCDVLIDRVLPRFGAVPYWKGSFHPIGTSKAIAVRFCINDALLNQVKTKGGLVGSVIKTFDRGLPELLNVNHPTNEVVHA